MVGRLLGGSIETSRVQEGQVRSLALTSSLERIDPVSPFPQRHNVPTRDPTYRDDLKMKSLIVPPDFQPLEFNLNATDPWRSFPMFPFTPIFIPL